PWPFKPFAASLPLIPLRNDSTHPPERGDYPANPSWVMGVNHLSSRNNLSFRRIRRHPRRHPLGILTKTPRSAEQEHHGQQQARRNQIHHIVQADRAKRLAHLAGA